MTKIIMTTLVVSLSMIGCANKAPRIESGKLEITQNTIVKTGKIANIVELSEKEVSIGKELLGGLTGALIGSAIAGGDDSTSNGLGIAIGDEIGSDIVRDKYGKTIYKLAIDLDDGTSKEVFAKGGKYIMNTAVKVTIDKNSGNITSFLVTK